MSTNSPPLDSVNFPSLPSATVIPTPSNNALHQDKGKNMHASQIDCSNVASLIPESSASSTAMSSLALLPSPPSTSSAQARWPTGPSATDHTDPWWTSNNSPATKSPPATTDKNNSNLRPSPPTKSPLVGTDNIVSNLRPSTPTHNLGLRMVRFQRKSKYSHSQPASFAELCSYATPRIGHSSTTSLGERPAYQFLPGLTDQPRNTNSDNSPTPPENSTPINVESSNSVTTPPANIEMNTWTSSNPSSILKTTPPSSNVPPFPPGPSEDSCSTNFSAPPTDDFPDVCKNFLLKLQKQIKQLKLYVSTNLRSNATHKNYLANKFLTIKDMCKSFETQIEEAAENQDTQATEPNILSSIDTLNSNLQATKTEFNNSLAQLSNNLLQSIPKLIEETVKKNLGDLTNNLVAANTTSRRTAEATATPYSTVLLQGKDRTKNNVELKKELLTLPCPPHVTVKNIATMPNGTLKVTCMGRGNADPLPQFLNSKINEKFTVCPPPQKKEAIIIFNIPVRCNDEDVIGLITRNFPSVDPKTLSILKNFTNKFDRNNWVVLMEPTTANLLLESKKLYHHFQYFVVKKYVSLRLCYKCQGFGHTAKYCTWTDSNCSFCSKQGHNHRSCKATTPTCINCCTANYKDNNLNWSTSHHSRDRTKCNAWKREVDRIRELQKTI